MPEPKYIAELEPGVWVAPWAGDPGRTIKRENAKRFRTRPAAKAAITRAQKTRPGYFLGARVDQYERKVVV